MARKKIHKSTAPGSAEERIAELELEVDSMHDTLSEVVKNILDFEQSLNQKLGLTGDDELHVLPEGDLFGVEVK